MQMVGWRAPCSRRFFLPPDPPLRRPLRIRTCAPAKRGLVYYFQAVSSPLDPTVAQTSGYEEQACVLLRLLPSLLILCVLESSNTKCSLSGISLKVCILSVLDPSGPPLWKRSSR